MLQISQKTGKPVTDVKNVTIWGNHSSTQYPDVNHGTVGGKPIREVVGDDEWLDGEFISTVQQRGATIIKVGIMLLCLHHWAHGLCMYNECRLGIPCM